MVSYKQWRGHPPRRARPRAPHVYVRRNIEHIPETDDVPAHYKWFEQKIPKKDWETYRMVLEHGDALDDVYAALTELAEMIVEG